MTTNAVAALVLRPGMDVDVRGQLALRDGEAVVTGYRMLRLAPGDVAELRWEATPYVDFELAAEHRPLIPILGHTVFGRGVWNGEIVTQCVLDQDDSWARNTGVAPETVKDLTPVSPHVRTIESELFSRGVILRRVRLRDAHGQRVFVSATDVDAARRALAPIYGDDLEVLESRWSVSELRELDDVLNDLHDDRVLKVEYRMDGDGVISRKLRVPYVDDDLVRMVGRFPDEMLVVEAVVEPHGVPQHRDPWFPARHGPLAQRRA